MSQCWLRSLTSWGVQVDYIAMLEFVGEGSKHETPEEKYDSLDLNGGKRD